MRIRLKHERLAALLAASRLSQNHWAMRLGLSRGHLSDLLKGRHPYVSARTREKLLEGLGVPFDDLFEEEYPRITTPVPPRPSTHHRLGAAMSTLLEDLRYALRVSARHRLVTGAVIATMALGIAVTTAVYSIVDAVLLSPLPFEGSEQVVRVGTVLRDGRYTMMNALPDVEDYRREAKTLSAVTAVSLSGTTITDGDMPEHQLVAYVDHGYDDVFSLRPIAGRFFVPEEYAFGSPRVALVTHALWQQRFGGDPGIVGTTISLDHQPVTIVGVLPPSKYTYPFPGIGFVAPLRPNPKAFHLNRGALWLRVAARIRPGATVAQAKDEIGAIGAGIAARFPDSNEGLKPRVESLRAAETGDARAMLTMLSAAVAAVLLIACVNIANLLLGQSHARAREFAVRAALGGRAGRLRRQVLTESLALSAAGGVIGIAVAAPLVRALVALSPGRLARVDEIAVDWRIAVVGLAVTMVAGLLAGVPTARRATGINLSRDLRLGGGRGVAGGRNTLGRVLIGSQVALSLALLFASVLLVQTLRTLGSTDPGFDGSNVTSFFVVAPPARYRETADMGRYFADVDDAVRAMPGVSMVATASEMPYSGNGSYDVFVMKERGDLGRDNPQVRVATVSPSYWQLLRAPIRSGRAFDPRDDDDAPRVVVVNEALAARFYPGQDPVGRRILFNREEWEIVGVAASMRMVSVAVPPEPQLYLPAAQNPRSGRYVLVRSAGAGPVAVPELRRVMRGIDPTIAMTEVATLDDLSGEATAPERFRAVLFTSLGLIALVLSALGIYGVFADTVTRQTRDIGIRMALGERASRVRRRIVASALRPLAAGAAAGLVLAYAAGRWLSGVLVGVEPTSLPALAGAVIVLGSVALAAAYIPARRASRVDPMIALRAD